jgi:phospholipase C
MPSRFHWDCGLPKTAAFKVAGKLFIASGLCGRASGQQATADLVKRIQDSSAWDSILIIITYDENGGSWDHVPPPPISSLTRPGCRRPNALNED